MTRNERTGESRMQAREPARRRFLNRLTLLAGGALLAPLFARMSATSAATTTAATRKQGHVVVFADSDAGALADRIAALGYDWTPVADQAAAHASVAARETVAVIGTGSGIAAALRFARSHAGVKAVFVMGTNHAGALDEFHALQAPRAYEVQVQGAVDAVDWQAAGRWLDRHMA